MPGGRGGHDGRWYRRRHPHDLAIQYCHDTCEAVHAFIGRDHHPGERCDVSDVIELPDGVGRAQLGDWIVAAATTSRSSTGDRFHHRYLLDDIRGAL